MEWTPYPGGRMTHERRRSGVVSSIVLELAIAGCEVAAERGKAERGHAGAQSRFAP